MRRYEFYKLDVFTDKLFTGNPLAVFPQAFGISSEEMQRIAFEMNLSETVFVLPSEKALRRLRIFTPKQELPLAGHPVVGTWNLLGQLGVFPLQKSGTVKITQELNLGVFPVEIEFSESAISNVWMTQDSFVPGATISAEEEISALAEGLGLKPRQIAATKELPIQIVSTGVKALDVPLDSLESLKNCDINSKQLIDAYLKYGAIGVFVFTFETIETASKVHARFFAPNDAIPEDPATGSAAGSFAGYAVHHGAITDKKFIIEQGDFMNRPGRIFARVAGEKANVKKVIIGGNSIITAKGEFYL